MHQPLRPPDYRRWPHAGGGGGRRREPRRPGFIVNLLGCNGLAATETLITSLPSPPPEHRLHSAGRIAASLSFFTRDAAEEAAVTLWGRRLDGEHLLTPVPANFSSHKLESRVRHLFISHARRLMDSELLRWTEKQAEQIAGDIERLACPRRQQRRFVSPVEYSEAKKKKGALEVEQSLILARIKEYKMALNCILRSLGGGNETVGEIFDNEGIEVIKLDKKIGFDRVHGMMLRESRRLRDGLPIYSYRQQILDHIFANQVLVLVGETGCGKSTQLVQYLADSGFADEGTIICTQPRRIAASSLQKRVSEEGLYCYQDDFVISYPNALPTRFPDSWIVYTTDSSLLRHCMINKQLAGISCIIVDEAHERNLNTDLLLALVKKLLLDRVDLRVVIMSATADASKLAEFFYGCYSFHVIGRSFPVDIQYVPSISAESTAVPKQESMINASYAHNVLKMVKTIHKTEGDGDILAFLTSQVEVEWACENFAEPTAVVLPMHGKLSAEEQSLVFKSFPSKRKIIFATNIAETSLTISGVNFVVDSGMEKASRFEPCSGMNVLVVDWISQSSACQRAGRAGRTGPGKCYRLYSESDFSNMELHSEPEIRKVHLGTAVLRILALGVPNVLDFEFVDAPSSMAIETALNNLVQLGAIQQKKSGFELTTAGNYLLKLGIEPRLGKIILDSHDCSLSKEGLVLAAVMANSSSIFCRVGTDADKFKADCLKVPFCHHDGDLFTLLSVYKKWEQQEPDMRSKWCWENSINAKSMKRCHQTILELENCLRHELNVIIPTYWLWNPDFSTVYGKSLKRIILSSLGSNLAMYSGYDGLGYVVASTGKAVQLHPSSSLLVFNKKPSWVVFGEILSASIDYLVCVTTVEYDDLCVGPCLFDIKLLERHKLHMNVISGLGSGLLKRLCGKLFQNIHKVISLIQKECMDDHATISVDFETKEVQLYATEGNMEKACSIFHDIITREKRWLTEECIERNLFYSRPGSFPSIALFGSGAEIKHLELENRYVTVEIFHQNANFLDDKDLICLVDKVVSGVANVHRVAGTGQTGADTTKWGRITFLTPDLAKNAVLKLKEVEIGGYFLKVNPVCCGSHRVLPFPAIKVKVFWPQRRSRGVALVSCLDGDAGTVAEDCNGLPLGEVHINCSVSRKFKNCVFVTGLPRNMHDFAILDAFKRATRKRIVRVNVLREESSAAPDISVYEAALSREISAFIRNGSNTGQNFRVEVYQPEATDTMVKATITFDGSLHLQAARALDHLQGRAPLGFFPWQTIQCQHDFHSTLSCPSRVYSVIGEQVKNYLESFRTEKGVRFDMDKNCNGCFLVKIAANATKVIADLRNLLEQLMKGKIVCHPSLNASILQLILSKEGSCVAKAIEQETQTIMIYDKHCLRLRIFGPIDLVATAEEKIVKSLLKLHENKQLEICLRGHNLPLDLMKQVIRKFGADLQGIKDEVPAVEVSLNTRRHILYVQGSKEQKQRVEQMITELSRCGDFDASVEQRQDNSCPVCLCEIEDPYELVACGHMLCRTCLVDQCESAIRSHDGFPLCCLKVECKQPILIVDLKAVLLSEKLDELFKASLSAFVASSGGTYRYCPTPDCPSVYRVAPRDEREPRPFLCGACSAETCTGCHLEAHRLISCERYKEFKDDPDLSLSAWRQGKDNVKSCPACERIIEKVDGCDHIECRCGRHICWTCLSSFGSSQDCYAHLRAVHLVFQEDLLVLP